METRIPDLGRFAEPALLILVSLSDGPKHGYAIMTDVEAGTGRPFVAGVTAGPTRRNTGESASAALHALRP